MAKFTLSSDSSCDLYWHVQKEYDINVIPLTFTREKNGEIVNMTDNFTEMSEYIDFYNQIEQQYFFRTSQINTFTHQEYFQKLIDENKKDVLHFSLSSGLSSTADAAKQAADEINKTSKYKVYAVDSLAATGGLAKLVLMAKDLRDANKSAKDAFEYFEDIKHKLQHWIFVSDLMHLKRGGRVSALSAVIGSALKIRPMLTVDSAGKLQVVAKYKGDKKATSGLIDYMHEYGIDIDNQTLHIVHTDRLELAEELKSQLEKITTAKIEILIMGPTIGAHVGPGALALTFIGKERYKSK